MEQLVGVFHTRYIYIFEWASSKDGEKWPSVRGEGEKERRSCFECDVARSNAREKPSYRETFMERSSWLLQRNASFPTMWIPCPRCTHCVNNSTISCILCFSFFFLLFYLLSSLLFFFLNANWIFFFSSFFFSKYVSSFTLNFNIGIIAHTRCSCNSMPPS